MQSKIFGKTGRCLQVQKLGIFLKNHSKNFARIVCQSILWEVDKVTVAMLHALPRSHCKPANQITLKLYRAARNALFSPYSGTQLFPPSSSSVPVISMTWELAGRSPTCCSKGHCIGAGGGWRCHSCSFSGRSQTLALEQTRSAIDVR